MDVDRFVQKVKEKKELRGVADEFIRTILAQQLKKNGVPRSEKDERVVLKAVRAELRMHTGRFHRGTPSLSTAQPEELLRTHLSTYERKDQYDVLKNLIAGVHPRSILDVGCGLNPLILATPHETYYACDIHEDEIERINTHFKHEGIKGKAFIADVRTYDSFPTADLCLMLKLLDVVDTKGHKNAESLIVRVPCKHIIASFPTRKLSGKRMTSPHRRWMEQLLQRNRLTFVQKRTDNEVFYLITKS